MQNAWEPRNLALGGRGAHAASCTTGTSGGAAAAPARLLLLLPGQEGRTPCTSRSGLAASSLSTAKGFTRVSYRARVCRG